MRGASSATCRSPPSAGCRPTARRPGRRCRRCGSPAGGSIRVDRVAFGLGSTTPPRERRPSAAKERLSRTDIGSIRPSVLRSSGISAMPMSLRLAARGPAIVDRPAVDQHLAGRAAQHAEEGQQQLALALAVEAAEADDLAGVHAERDVVEPVGPAEAGAARGAALRRSAPAAASAGRRRRIRARSSSRRPRSSLFVPAAIGARRCGRCGTPCTRRRARRSRACDGRCRRSPGPRRAGASAPRRPSSTSAAVSAEVASSRIRIRGLRASALAISTICRRDSGRSLTSASGWMSSAPTRASASSAMRRWARRSIRPKRRGGLLMAILSATVRSGISDSSWKMQTMPAALRRRRRRERDRPAVEQDAAAVGLRRRRP